MDVAIITGAAGLVGSESARFFLRNGYHVVGIDNDMRRYFFGEEGSTRINWKICLHYCYGCNYLIRSISSSPISKVR